MKMKKILSLSLVLFSSAILAQTSFGNLNFGNAGNLGGSTGSYFGYEAGNFSTAANNTFIGYRSGRLTTSGYSNTAIGSDAFYFNTTGDLNTAIGQYALRSNTIGNSNTATGRGTLERSTTGSFNSAGGYSALAWSTTGSYNVAFGAYSLYLSTTASYNTAIGYEVLRNNSIGRDNVAAGYKAMRNNTTGSENVAFGRDALFTNTDGWENTAIGHKALLNAVTSQNNTAIGYQALWHNTSGNNNVGVGSVALHNNFTGSFNSAIGYQTENGGSSSYGTYIGALSGVVSFSALTNVTAIGYFARATASNQVRIGNTSVTSIGGYAPWSNLSDGRFKKNIKEDIPGLNFVKQLRPVSYEIRTEKLIAFLGKEDKDVSSKMQSAKTLQNTRRSIGFVAQEVEELLNENNYVQIGIETPQNEQDHYSIRYAEFVVPLVKAVQELSKENDKLKEELAEIRESIRNIGTEPSDSNLPQIGEGLLDLDGLALSQNTPNPFSQTTAIRANIPSEVKQAKIIVYDLQGVELKSYSINSRGDTSVNIEGGSFQSGMYIYALIADGQIVETKRMVLTK